MARRPKQQSLLDIALAESWKVSATFAIILSLITFVVLPSVSNPILKAFTQVLRPMGYVLIAFFGLIAISKFFVQKTSNLKTGTYQQNKDSKPASWVPPTYAPKGILNTDWDASFAKNRESRSQERPDNWSLKLIQDIEWKRFEELSTAYYLEKGIRAEATPLGADGGIDIKLYQDDSGKPTSIVQCKAWNSRMVGVKEIREFLGVLTHEKIAKGFYMTSGEYSDDAKETAKANRITLINGEMLLMMIKRVPDKSQKKLLALATEGDYTTPTCPSCGVKMIKRSSKRGEFWGCQNYPRCRQMLHVKKSSEHD